ncbi:retinoic acid-induced protein 1 isoform X1 [Paramormyrops kingsleyae]|uniref:retinoic acid-induced protein 1 isoform X1 n=1 Tax=Paramormyrops kingsleyae TaxID=1676925 RepID=UPI003B97094F
MQSFRERSGFHGNQPCYQQEPHELSRLENYRHHHGQARQGYETQSLSAPAAAAAAAAGPGSKDCYGQTAYQGYGASPAQAKKQYKGGKISGQPLPAGFGNRLGAAYLAQYLSEGHLQQKWEDPTHLPQYKQDMVGRLEAATGPGGTTPQYLEQNVQPISQSQCSHAAQPSAPIYTSHHQQNLPQNTSPSPLAYSQGHLHFPQHSQSLSTSTSSYMEKCSSIPHCYKGYAMPPNSQFNRPVGSNNSLKQSTYISQNSYTYQQPASRAGYDQQASLQGISGSQDGLSKYQHFSQQQQNYCLSDMAVRSPEHYYQNCSPSSSHSPARSVGRSPSYSSTPSPLMVNSETFQYNQQPIHTGNPTSANLPEQGLLMPPHSHTSPSINHPTASYTSSMKDRFSEKLLSNPSLWSLNALTSQVENISNNVQQLLLSEALIANKKGSKRNGTKKGDEFKGQLRSLEDGSCSDVQQGTPVPETFSTPQSIHTEMQEGGYSSSSEDQMERNYYCCGQNRSPAQANANPQLSQDLVSSCSLTSPNDMSKPEDCIPSLQSAQTGDNLNALPWLQSTPAQESVNASLTNTAEKSPQSTVTPSPQEPGQNSPPDRQGQEDPLKENFEELAWSEKQTDENRAMKETAITDYNNKTGVSQASVQEAQKTEQKWPEEDKCQALFHTVSKALAEKKYHNDMENKSNQYYLAREDSAEKSDGVSHLTHKGDTDDGEILMKSEMYRSEMPTDSDMPEKTMSFFWRDDLVQDQYFTVKEDNSELPQFTTRSELLEERLLTVEKETREALEAQPSVLSHQPAEVRKEKETLLPSEEVINNTIWSRESGDFCHLAEEHGDKPPVNTENATQDAVLTRAERRSVARDSVSPSHSVKTAFSALVERATPPSQAREHIDRRDAEVLEPDSPQLPGKSILHSAPSWADTPPSPKKGDEDIEPGISSPSAVTPSTKSEPVAPLANIRVLNRKLGRGRRSQATRRIEAGGRIRRHPGMEAEGVTASPQTNTLPCTESGLFPDQPNSSQTPKRFAENFPSRMCTRSVTALAAPKDCHHLKRQLGPKIPERTASESPGLPKDLVTKIKWMRQKGPEHTTTDEASYMGSLTGSSQQDDNQDTASQLPPLTKDQKPMVLRSRKSAQENPLKEKRKEKKILCHLPKKMKEPKRPKDTLLNDDGCLSPKQNQASAPKSYRTLTTYPDEKTVSLNKRKSSFHSSIPLKKHKGMKPGTPESKELHLPATLMTMKGPKKKLKQVEHLQASPSSCLTKDIPIVSSTGEIHSTPPQCLTKTKYLPPRKGRGLKYEAMVQKITSPGSKKHVPFSQAENTPMEVTSKMTQQDLVPKEMEKPPEVMPEDSNMWRIVPMPDTDCAKATIRRRKGISTENEEEVRVARDAGVVAETRVVAEANSPTVNTPRLAKQRAIKNNYEMHLKQRRKRRKGPILPESVTSTERHGPHPASVVPDYTGDLTGSSQAITAVGACKRGKRKIPPARKNLAKVLGKDNSKKQNIIKKSGPKRRNKKTSKPGKPTEMGRRTKARQMEQNSPVVQENQPEMTLKYILYKTQKNESRPFFSPYVHIDSSRNFASLCTIVNRPEEELLLLQTMKKNSAKIKNSVTVAKAIPNSSVMLQGPLVNKNLTDRCLTCCLCGKPANYRELGDLCGPYYPEDSIPRKTLSLRHKLESTDDREKMSYSAVPRSPPMREAVSGFSCWGSRGLQSGLTRRAEGLPWGSGTPRPSFREQYRKLQRLQSYERRPGDGDNVLLRRIQLEAEAKEHWAHEACIVWTNGVVLVAGKLYGLKEAAQAAAQTPCSLCQNVGASVSCCRKGCPQKFHFVCAKETGCLLQEDNFSMKCTKHKVKTLP